jgi:hypothetical protein
MKISQSLLKGVFDYNQNKECGLLFKAKYIDGRYDLFPPSESQNLGAWFEYMATGSIPKNGDIPKAEYMKRAKDDDGNPRLASDYVVMLNQVKNFKQTMEHYGFEILRAGEDIKVLYPDSLETFGVEVWLTGTLDIRARATRDIYTIDRNRYKILVCEKDEEIIIDLKSTGLLDDRWNDFGWDIDNLHNKIKLITQPIHYKYIEYLKTGTGSGTGLPFLFMLYSMKNPNDARIIDFKIDESAFDEHKKFINLGIKILLNYEKYGYKPLPSLSKCAECPLRDTCDYKVSVPPISVFYYAYQP